MCCLNRLNDVEKRGVGVEAREVEGFQSMSEHRARLEFRVQELEGAIVAVSNRGEQVAKDTGDAVRTFVDVKNSELLDQLQKAVMHLTAQVRCSESSVLTLCVYFSLLGLAFRYACTRTLLSASQEFRASIICDCTSFEMA